MILYCCFFAFLSVENMNDKSDISSQPLGVQNHLEGFKQRPSSLSSSLRGRPTLPPNKTGFSNLLVPHNGNDHSSSTDRLKLQEKLDKIYLETQQSFDGNLWELSDYIPQWMKGRGLKIVRQIDVSSFSSLMPYCCFCVFLLCL